MDASVVTSGIAVNGLHKASTVDESSNLSKPMEDASNAAEDAERSISLSAQCASVQQQRQQKLQFQRQRALKAVEKYNSALNTQRINLRTSYFDLQTNLVHLPRRPVRVLPFPAELEGKIQDPAASPPRPRAPRTGLYPAAMTFSPPQYVDSVPIFTPKELACLPMGSVVQSVNPRAVRCLNMTIEEHKALKRKLEDNGSFETLSRASTPLLTDEEPIESEPAKPEPSSEPTAPKLLDAVLSAPKTPKVAARTPGKRGRPARTPAEPIKTEEVDAVHERVSALADPAFVPTDCCFVCFTENKVKTEEPEKGATAKKRARGGAGKNGPLEDLINCTKCTKRFHPSCIQLPKTTQFLMKNYPWVCTDCKVCSKCNSSGKEDKMMFCDLCDRGYHTFCSKSKVGRVPLGRWLCEHCALCSLCGANRPNEEGKRGRACIWQFDCEENAKGDITSIRIICYRCYKQRKLAAKAAKSGNGGGEEDKDDDDEGSGQDD